MKISDLIYELREVMEIYGDIEVMSSSNYGDYSRTEQLDEIRSIEACVPVDSAYSGTGLAFPSDDEDEDDDGFVSDGEQVLVLRYV
jgi:hypothetical protein